jgi:hypothetical protein
MRIKLASVILVMGLFATSMAPANAVFGLSKCERVKKQVLAHEATWKRLAADFAPAMDKNGQFFPESTFNSYVSKMNKSLNHGVVMYRFQRNNPKCFTITQNEQISRNWTAINTGIVEWNKIYFDSYWNRFPIFKVTSIYSR